MFSVTSDIASSPSFQPARQNPVRDDPSSGPDSFGSLVDRNTAADNSSAPAVVSIADLAPAPPPQRSDDGSSRTDNNSSSQSADRSNAANAPDRNTSANSNDDDKDVSGTNGNAAPTDLKDPKDLQESKASRTEKKTDKRTAPQ